MKTYCVFTFILLIIKLRSMICLYVHRNISLFDALSNFHALEDQVFLIAFRFHNQCDALDQMLTCFCPLKSQKDMSAHR